MLEVTYGDVNTRMVGLTSKNIGRSATRRRTPICRAIKLIIIGGCARSPASLRLIGDVRIGVVDDGIRHMQLGDSVATKWSDG